MIMETQVPFGNLLAQYEQIKMEIDEAISYTIRQSAFIGGEAVEKFEQIFSKLIGARHCISCANGTDALYIAMRGLGITAGDEVITTAHSWFSTSEAITQAGGRVVFCDTSEDTFCINPDLIADKITERTVGIVPVHLYGHPANMERIMQIASSHDLWVLEDCAQAHMASLRGQAVGTFGVAATYSFYPGKNLGAMGDAGAIVTNNADFAEWCSLFARHGGKGMHVLEGINSRMDGIQAAILNAKIPHLVEWTAARRKAAAYYNSCLSDISELRTPATEDGAHHVFHLYTVLSARRDELRRYLKENGVETNVNYPVALPFLPAYASFQYSPEQYPVAFANQSRILSLPLYPEITRDQQDYVSSLIHRFYKGL